MRSAPLHVWYATCLKVTACARRGDSQDPGDVAHRHPARQAAHQRDRRRSCPAPAPVHVASIIRPRRSDCSLPVAAAGYLHDLADISSLKDGQLLTITAGQLAGAMHAPCPPRCRLGQHAPARPRGALCEQSWAWWQVMSRQSRIRIRDRSCRAHQRFPTTPARRSMTSSLQTRCCWDRTVEQPPRAR